MAYSWKVDIFITDYDGKKFHFTEKNISKLIVEGYQ